LVLAGLLSLGDIALGGLAPLAFEELLNARAAVLLACGHAAELSLLQYRFFCGGCTVDAVVGAGWISLMGPQTLAWKLVPLGWHLMALAASLVLAQRASGTAGAWVVGALWLGAPTAWRELALTGWGNHAESAAFTFGAAALLVAGARRARWGLLAGMVAGCGLYFAWISAHALPALLVGAWLGGRARLVTAALLGLPLGVAPWLIMELGPTGVFGTDGRPNVVAQARDMVMALSTAAPGPLWQLVTEPLAPGRLWPTPDGFIGWAGAGAATLVAILGLMGAAVGLGGVRRGEPAAAARVLPALGLLGLFLAFALRQDLWADVPALAGFDPFHLRYRVPAFPLLVLGVGLLAGASRGGRVVTGVALLLGAGGLAARVAGWSGGTDLTAPLAVIGLSADPTLPGGEPRQRDPGRRVRAVDITAGGAWLQTHSDSLPVCAEIHAAELDRRRAACTEAACTP